MKKLTAKQKMFVDCYDGDIRSTAKKANLSYIYGRQLMTLEKHSHIVAAIKTREHTKSNRKIKTREERQQWWSNMMDTAEKDTDKLKASELLGRSNADFTENNNLTGDLTILVQKFTGDIEKG